MKNLEKQLKGYLKRRYKINLSLLVVFLITGQLGYSLDIYEDWINNGTLNETINIMLPKVNITNNGIINSDSNNLEYSKNAILSVCNNYNSNHSSIGNIFNNGVLRGYSNHSDSFISGNGILSKSSNSNYSDGSSNIGNIFNNGTINGYSNYSDSLFSGNGILSLSNNINYDHSHSSIGNINNSGIIGGYSNSSHTSISGNGIISSSYGFFTKRSSIGDIFNNGMIMGSNYAIISDNGSIGNVTNNGILAGKHIISSDIIDAYNNNGIEILLNEKDEIKEIFNGSNNTSNNGYSIINAQRYDKNGNKTEEKTLSTDSYISSSELTNYDNLIINGAGINIGALVIDKNININDSIINGYETAVYLKGENSLQATNTTFNGGGLKNDIDVIVGDNDNNRISILGDSIINGDVNLNDGNDNLSIATSTQINGDLIGGIGKDTLNLINSNKTLNIYNNISEFENLNINGNTTLFETSKITGAENITLSSGILTLRIDTTKKDSNGKVIGHSLYENSGIVNSSGGKLNLGLNGLGENTIISMGETSINPSLNTNYDNTDKLITDSIVLDATLVDGSNGKHIKISVIDKLPVDPLTMGPELYDHLNSSYKSIISSGELGKLANTTFVDRIPEALLVKATTTPIKTYDDAMAGLLGILDQISTNNPYTYTLKSGRDSLKLFEDNMSYLTIKPNNNQWIVQGKAIYTGVKVDNEVSGKGHYGFDTGHRNYKTTTNTVGGLTTFEYGLSNKSSLGLVFGGNNQDVSFRGSNSIDGNSLYVGSFIKTEINKFKFMTGLGYQYTSNDVDRSVSNQYDSFKTNEKYDVNSLNFFVEGKYSINIDNQWIIEPKVKLSYYFVNQDKVNEGYSTDQLSIGVDKFTTNTGDLEIGFDFKKELLYSKGKLNNILSFGVINTIGPKEEDLKAYIIGKDVNGSKFDIQGVKLPTTSGKVAYNMEFEQPNGIIYSAGVNFEFAKDNNRNVNTTLGLGYRF
ncbi:autotransporter outer membrane beta-barrel domain-containing protein [uncultured Cetobacterium sp.]|uniref:autotransporter family protein n=2 Tax=uncultured Cetobacterium sp. TaxID=527638 RepID=UPI002637B3C6|nr:autotransporter outer membrane beta-barrel domain-containing protein [uncultured Cetobacterium sp.]